ncbi:MAG: hypothetical protein IMX00_06145 [Limnochordales bacterium]|nr:hypothetical protein [Limnochordales bacterium]
MSDWLWLRWVRRASASVGLTCLLASAWVTFGFLAAPRTWAGDQAERLLAQALGAEFNLPASYLESTVQFLADRSHVTYRSVWQVPPLYRIEQESPTFRLTLLETPQGTSAWMDRSAYLFRLAAGGIQLRLRLLELGGAPIPYVLLSEALSQAAAATLTARPATMGARAVTVVTASRNGGRLEFWIDQENHFTWKIVQYDRSDEILVLILRAGVSLPPRTTPSLQLPAELAGRRVLQSLDEWRQVTLAEQLYRELGAGGTLIPWVLLPPLRWIAAETVRDSGPPLVILRIMTPAGAVSLYVQRDTSGSRGGAGLGSFGAAGSVWSLRIGSPSWLLPMTSSWGLREESGSVFAARPFEAEVSGFRVIAAGSIDESLFQQILRSLRLLTTDLVTGRGQ